MLLKKNCKYFVNFQTWFSASKICHVTSVFNRQKLHVLKLILENKFQKLNLVANKFRSYLFLYGLISVNFLQFSAKNFVKQECIPVGCVLPAAVAVRGVSTRHPPCSRPPSREQTPQDQAPSPPGSRHPLLQGMLGYHLQCMLGYHPPRERNHTHV